jgi:hypothetical protein
MLCREETSKIHLAQNQGPYFLLPRSGCLLKQKCVNSSVNRESYSLFRSILQVRTLLNDYITDEEQGVVSGRNPISSINEVLREGKYNRDKSKV